MTLELRPTAVTDVRPIDRSDSYVRLESCPTPSPTPTGPAEPTLAEVIARAKPIGDLSRFGIDDLTDEDEDEFFGILADL